jgi:hypothetical protein
MHPYSALKTEVNITPKRSKYRLNFGVSQHNNAVKNLPLKRSTTVYRPFRANFNKGTGNVNNIINHRISVLLGSYCIRNIALCWRTISHITLVQFNSALFLPVYSTC